MGHRDYTNTDFTSPRTQHNVIAFVGSGFDIQVMHDYESPIDTRYESFYHFLKLRSFDEENLIFQEMGRLREGGKKYWSDVENAVGELLTTRRTDPGQLSDALRKLQEQFSEFLDLAVPSSLLVRLGADSMDRSLAIKSLAGFLGASDHWWWKKIASVLGQPRERPDGSGSFVSELILYWYNDGEDPLTRDLARRRFLESAGNPEQRELETYIRVVLHDASTERTWLSIS